MKSTSGIASKFLAHGFAAILLGCVSFVSVAGTNGDAIVQTVGGVSYVSGGVGTESIDRLNSLAGGFNLKLVFASKSGAYLTDVRVTIADTNDGKAVRQQISVGTEKLRTVDFRWASE